MNTKKKPGRNDPCPCGSGLKYKKCHGQLSIKSVSDTSEKIKSIMGAFEAKEELRKSQQGQGKPVISIEHQGYRFTAVGNELHYAKTHKTFIDFLGDYIAGVLGSSWGNQEIAKPLEERHQIMRWYDAICAFQRSFKKKPKGVVESVAINGLLSAYYGLAYNLYLLQHNVEIQEYLIKRLKQPLSFYSAYYETCVAGWFILAGFKIGLENEQDPTRTHPEFIATRSGQSYSVEAKTRQPEKNHFDVGNQLYSGLSIESKHSRVVFIDMNVGIGADLKEFAGKAFESIRSREATLTIKGDSAPPAYIFVTNQPDHLALYESCVPRVCLPVGYKVSDFGYGSKFASYTDAHKARLKYSALNDVCEAMVNYRIPATFDGELPEFSFGDSERRFSIGEQFVMADGVSVTLESGVVVESEKNVYLVAVDAQGRRHMLTAPLSETEMNAYRRHPETFFGRIISVSENIEDPMDLYAFFYNGYKDTSREKLLEFMSGSPDIEKLKKLPDNELPFVYAEGLTHGALRDKRLL